MSDDDSFNVARFRDLDPLTSPNSKFADKVDSVRGSDVEEIMSSKEDTMIRQRPLLPPDADEIIRGEYTGWVPLIKPGETLADAKAREEKLALYLNPVERDTNYMSEFSAPINFASDSVSQIGKPIVEFIPANFPNAIVADPESVLSPTEALEEARRRIAQMRSSLQTNINRAPQNFAVPIFTEQIEEIGLKEISDLPADEQEITSQTFESLFETIPTSEQGWSQEPEPVEIQVHEESQVYTQTTQQASPTVIIDEAADKTQSLELVIMRDEIKNLRDRLDTSDKLIENLMVRLADIAELAIKHRD
jgi:HAMP domain-containing protein